jgi:retinol dehydrogenase-12
MDKVALVTGGTDGIGKEIAIGLARTRCHVLIVGRDPAKGLNAQSDIRCRTRNTNVHFLRADLGLVRDAQRLAADVTQRFASLSIRKRHRCVLPIRPTVQSDRRSGNGPQS